MFSVLMSIYKNDRVDFLEEALDSLLNQAIYPEQIVLVKDGPVGKDLGLIVEKFKGLFSVLGVDFFIHTIKENVGLGLALQSGLDFCTGEYIVRMDSDDISTENRILMIKEFANNNPSVDIFGSYIEEFNICLGDQGLIRKVPLDNEQIASYSKKRNPMNHVTVCFRKKSIQLTGGYEDVLYHEDYYLWLKSIKYGLTLANIPFVTVYVRAGGGMVGRRHGLTYLKCEYNFVKKAVKLNSFNYIEAINYLLPRLVIRFIHKKILLSFYTFFLRSKEGG
jgi:glycosyltransferase involved in cell wall biosynthesis